MFFEAGAGIVVFAHQAAGFVVEEAGNVGADGLLDALAEGIDRELAGAAAGRDCYRAIVGAVGPGGGAVYGAVAGGVVGDELNS